MKQILLELLAEIEDLRANQVLLAQRVGIGVSIREAEEAKHSAYQANRKPFEEIRAKIEALS